ncbi:MAG: class I SAM-dependent methyltransferase, partial [Actinomycetota bacterium]
NYPNVRFDVADHGVFPFPDASVDAVVSLQVIEHLASPRDFVVECARVLRPGGTFVLSTPNRLTFSPRGIRNPFHTVEFAPDELRGVLESRFDVAMLGGTFHRNRLRFCELFMRTGLPERLIAQPVPEWPAWLRRLVNRVTPKDFAISDRDVDRSLDLVAVARRR